MGRTPAITNHRRRIDEGHPPDTPDSPQKTLYPRRFPRLGIQFQTKLPKSSRPLLRAIPERMSSEYPHISETIQQNHNRGDHVSNITATVNNNEIPTTKSTTAPAAAPGRPRQRPAAEPLELPTTKRGGLLLHTPTDNMDIFPSYVQPLIQSLDYDPPSNTTEDEAWKQHMVHLHNKEPLNKKRGRSNRAAATRAGSGPGMKKRKRGGGKDKNNNKDSSDDNEEAAALKKQPKVDDDTSKNKDSHHPDDDLVWNLEELVQKREQQHYHMNTTDATSSRRATTTTTSCGEEDACALEYMHSHHSNNINAAKMNLLVDLSAGKATKMRRCIEQRRSQEKKKQKFIPLTTSDSWRNKYESMSFQPVVANFEDSDRIYYAQMLSDYGINPTMADPETNLTSNKDDLKGVWRSVLACGKAMERQLDGIAAAASSSSSSSSSNNQRKLLLSTIVSFISNVYGLPTPEYTFGTNHLLVEEVSACMLKIMEHVDKARQTHAKLRDRLYSESKDGIDSDGLLKFLDNESKLISIRLDDAAHLYQARAVVVEWEGRATELIESEDAEEDSMECTNDELRMAEDMAVEARSHGYACKGLVQLKARIQKAYVLRNKIEKWKVCSLGEKKGTIKNVAALVRESNRVKLMFPEVAELRTFHSQAEGWVDRANVAIRSRISLEEIEELICRGEEMQLDLSDYIEKLRARVASGIQWRTDVEEVVPFPRTQERGIDWLKWLREVRTCLHDGKHGRLHDLASEGSRIPVEVLAVKLLQVELDAKNWTQKARKWIPQTDDSKKGKLEDLREHVEKAQSLRERLVLPDQEKEAWVLDGESELCNIVEAADEWNEKNKAFLVYDNRRKGNRSCLSIKALREIVGEVNAIHANLGNSAVKINRILTQAESWYEQYGTLVDQCNAAQSGQTCPHLCVAMSEMTNAVAAAEADVSLGLDEALSLKKLAESAKSWLDKIEVAAPKRSKRQGRTSRPKLKIEDLNDLIQEASCLPIDTVDGVHRLQERVQAVEAWQVEAGDELVKIAAGFDQFRERLCLGFGNPKEFRLDQKYTEDSNETDDDDSSEDDMDVEAANGSQSSPDGNTTPSEAMSTEDDDDASKLLVDMKDANVNRMIKDLQEGSRLHGVATREAEITDILESVSHWCIKSVKYLTCSRDIFDKRYFGAFDRFIKEGQEIAEKSQASWDSAYGKENWDSLGPRWGCTVQDQLERLLILRAEREKFIEWCNMATQILNDEKKLTVEKLEGLAEQSRCFPAVSDMVQKVRGLSVKAKKWTEKARKVLNSGKKLSMQDAKTLLESGEKLKVNTNEVRSLKTALRAVRGWAMRVKRSNLEQGSGHVGTVKDLIEEHETFLIEMPEELEMLQSATQSYCVCRRPYSGFMIGCDECEEWYHGQCIGVSESRADRFDKYVCIRCSIKKIFKNSASSAVRIVRKWTSCSEKKKARQVEYQKTQRKVRKEMKDIEKYREEVEKMKKLLATSAVPTSPSHGVPPCDIVDDEKKEEATGIVVETGATDEKKEEASEMVVEPQATATESKDLSPKDKDEVQAKLDAITKSIQEAERRLEVFRKELAHRKQLDSLEDFKAVEIRRWCVRVRSLVLVPSKEELVERARPPPHGELSDSMLALISDAKTLGVFGLTDVDAMVNTFKCMSWSLFALSVLRRKATLGELQLLVTKASSLKLPDEKPLRTIKVMATRGAQWQAKVRKALSPKPGQTKPLSLQMLKTLLAEIDESAVRIPGILNLKNAIADKGARHCICGGPNYGGLMLCCDKCERWYHDTCVKTSVDAKSLEPNPLDKWLCAACKGEKFPALPDDIENGQLFMPDVSTSAAGDLPGNSDCSPHAPHPDKLWPPFGFNDATVAIELLGPECASFPDDCDSLSSQPPMPSTNQPLHVSAITRMKAHSKSPTQETKTLPLSKPISISSGLEANKPINEHVIPSRDGTSKPTMNGNSKPLLATQTRDLSAVATKQKAQAAAPKEISGPGLIRSGSPIPKTEIPNPLHAVNALAKQILNDKHARPNNVASSIAAVPPKVQTNEGISSQGQPTGGLASHERLGSEIACDNRHGAVGEDIPNPLKFSVPVRLDARKKRKKLPSICNPLQVDKSSSDPGKALSEVSKSDGQRSTAKKCDGDSTMSKQISEPSQIVSNGEVSKSNVDSENSLSHTTVSSPKPDTERISSGTEENATVTPSSSVQILDTEPERVDGVGSYGPDDRSDKCQSQPDSDTCFDKAERPAPLTSPLADMRVALKQASN